MKAIQCAPPDLITIKSFRQSCNYDKLNRQNDTTWTNALQI